MSVCLPHESTAPSLLLHRRTFAASAFRNGTILRWLTACGVLSLAAAATVAMIPSPEPPPLLTIEKSPFRIDLTMAGTLEPLRTERVISQCQWTVQILSLVPEGTWVRKGDIVCVLDSSEIEEFQRARQVSLVKAQAALEASRQQQELTRAANERRLSEADHQLRSAEMDLLEYANGVHPNDLRKLADEISISQDQLLAIEGDLEFTEEMWMVGYANRAEVAAESLKQTTQSEALRRLEGQRTLLQQFGHPRQDAEMQHRLSNSRLNVVRTSLANSIALSRAKLLELSDQTRLSIYERYAKSASDSIRACVLRAPRDGQVLHCNNWHLRSRGVRTIEEGKSVYFSQPVFEIPDQDHLKIRLPLNESLITKVAVGAKVMIRPLGLNGEGVPAEIFRISPYPVVRSSFAPDVKEYFLDAVLKPNTEQQQKLHARMEAEGILTLLEKADAVTVPKSAIARLSGQNMVLRRQGERFLPHHVVPGEVADDRVLIQSGLQEGDQIVAAITETQIQSLQDQLVSR